MNGAPEIAAEEIAGRLARAREWLTAHEADALLLTTAAELRYFGNFRTAFLRSPSRPWFLIVPSAGAPVAVVPEIGAARMRAGGAAAEVRTWPSPRPEDEGVTKLAAALGDGRKWMDATPLVRELRMVKSAAEVALIGRACRAASDGFEAAAALWTTGMSEAEAARILKMECLRAGADDAPYAAGGAAAGGPPADVIAPPGERRLRRGDVLNLDLGCARDGYYSDFNRNFSLGPADAATARMYRALWRATEAGMAAARPGALCAEVFRAMARSLEADGGRPAATGRMGHGVGLQLTEWPSLAARDRTALRAGMVLAVEPTAIFAGGRTMTHEENIVVRADGAELLSRRAPAELPEL